VVLRDDPCPCGRTGPRIARVAGRVDESTKVRGMFVYPEQIAEVMSRHPEVERWQAVVEKNAQGTDDFRLAVQLTSELPGLLEKIAQAVEIALGAPKVALGLPRISQGLAKIR